MLGKVLKYRDDYSEEDLKKYEEQTDKIRSRVFRENKKGKIISFGAGSQKYVGYNYIHYGLELSGTDKQSKP